MTSIPTPTTAIIVVAAGSGTRLGADMPKALVDIDGRTVLRHALDGVFAAQRMQVVVVAPAGFEQAAADMLTDADQGRAWPASVVVGGQTRQQSVAAGLAALDAEIDVVLVHDAARALTSAAQIDAVAAAVTPDAGVIPALPVVDTLKQVSGDEVVGPVDRSLLAAAQTPQGFPRRALEAAYERVLLTGDEHTDDAALFAADGGTVRRIPGSERAFKITTAEDLERARMLLTQRMPSPPMLPRIGVGTDVHAFGGEGNLWLAGLEWPGEQPLSGHSDGDAVAHAMVDALLGAAGLGDIGQHFGTAHPEYAGAHADVFLARTAAMLAEAGFAIGNVSVQFQGNRPRFSARRIEAEQVLSAALGGAAVTVSATTTDGLGFTGRGEGIAVTAVALVHRI
ncbi:bifunctional 2-C-methyl-D-erythritol 4-phosphate cytidylyltransferase/2-C-methyl-D-erythritol 2,4-cyclodiphosphate synthase [Actinomycetales bacterium SN12]|nr:bifunctional 2-C-methyl-D-erythritol 4-phosphate cytidylyltransferase/2-C-methyl-D-erythritol 2,4-cyclodiphosphate synthase [Actinomycetales bacterium SN12]